MKRIAILSVVLMLVLVGCYKAPETVELEIDNISEGQSVLGQIQEIAQEVADGEVLDEDMPELIVSETELVSLQLDASDADEDSLMFSFSEPLDQNGKWETNYGDAGEYIVTVTASDGQLTTSKHIKLIVLKKNEAPEIEGISDLDVVEGDVVRLEPQITDVNGDDIILTISDPVGEDGVWETDHTSSGTYEIAVSASDGELTTERTIVLFVADKNVPPEVKIADSVAIKEGETVKFEPEVSDLDNDQVSVTISDPVGDDGIWETGYTDHGEYLITVSASDGKDTTVKEIMLTVEDVNVAPEIVEITLG